MVKNIIKLIFFVAIFSYSCLTQTMQSFRQRDIARTDAFAWIADHVAAHVREAHHEAQVRAQVRLRTRLRRVWHVSRSVRALIAQFENLPRPLSREQYKHFFDSAVEELYTPLIRAIVARGGMRGLDVISVCLLKFDRCIQNFRDTRSVDIHVILWIMRYVILNGAQLERNDGDEHLADFMLAVFPRYEHFVDYPFVVSDIYETMRLFIASGASIDSDINPKSITPLRFAEHFDSRLFPAYRDYRPIAPLFHQWVQGYRDYQRYLDGVVTGRFYNEDPVNRDRPLCRLL